MVLKEDGFCYCDTCGHKHFQKKKRPEKPVEPPVQQAEPPYHA